MSRGLRIAVLVKQIPQPSELALVDGRLVRTGVPFETNAYCRRANARAVEIAGTDGEVVVFTMGPPDAEHTLREMIACGATRGVLVSDPALAGSDTLITSRVLAAAIRRAGPFDAVFTGAYSLDSETGHVGIQVAELLGLPFVGPCRTLEIADDALLASVEVEGGRCGVEVMLPAVAAAAERLCDPSKASRERCAEVAADRITHVRAADLGLDPGAVGLAASPTQVGPVTTRVTTARRGLRAATGREAIWLLRDLGSLAPPAEVPQARRPRLVEETREAVWCVLDPQSDGHPCDLLDATAGAARTAARPVVAVTNRPDEEVLLRADHVLHLIGATAPEDWVAAIAPELLARRPHAVLIESSPWGRELAARLAARLGWGLVGDAVDLTVDAGALVAWKSAFSGQAQVPIESTSPTLLATLRTAGLAGSAVEIRDRPAPVEQLAITSVSKVVYDQVEGRDADARAVARADRLIVVGAGVPPEEYHLLEPLRAALDAGPLACTRKVADKGWLPRTRQVGITGRSVAPRLVISIGASGRFNHSSGFRSAETVLAVNTDPEAEVFALADVGVVGDWRDVVDDLRAGLAEVIGDDDLAEPIRGTA